LSKLTADAPAVKVPAFDQFPPTAIVPPEDALSVAPDWIARSEPKSAPDADRVRVAFEVRVNAFVTARLPELKLSLDESTTPSVVAVMAAEVVTPLPETFDMVKLRKLRVPLMA